mmetsp:Transcript_12276/g.33712  ORF Transcript_12276/g.33712 Transcript_12276/m.33712 type:complete len:268 (+) Transcript_12276:367-1170(+)
MLDGVVTRRDKCRPHERRSMTPDATIGSRLETQNMSATASPTSPTASPNQSAIGSNTASGASSTTSATMSTPASACSEPVTWSTRRTPPTANPAATATNAPPATSCPPRLWPCCLFTTSSTVSLLLGRGTAILSPALAPLGTLTRILLPGLSGLSTKMVVAADLGGTVTITSPPFGRRGSFGGTSPLGALMILLLFDTVFVWVISSKSKRYITSRNVYCTCFCPTRKARLSMTSSLESKSCHRVSALNWNLFSLLTLPVLPVGGVDA